VQQAPNGAHRILCYAGERQVVRLRSGFCLEPQRSPDSPNHANFPTTELKPGEKYHQTTQYRISARYHIQNTSQVMQEGCKRRRIEERSTVTLLTCYQQRNRTQQVVT